MMPGILPLVRDMRQNIPPGRKNSTEVMMRAPDSSKLLFNKTVSSGKPE
jgi:hypothetical protein